MKKSIPHLFVLFLVFGSVHADAKYFWSLPGREIQKTSTGAIYTSYHSTIWGNPFSKKSALKTVTKDFAGFVNHLNQKVTEFAQAANSEVPVHYNLVSVDVIGTAGIGERVYKLSIEAVGDRVGCVDTTNKINVGIVKTFKYITLTGQDLYFDVGLSRYQVFDSNLQNYVDYLLMSLCD